MLPTFAMTKTKRFGTRSSLSRTSNRDCWPSCMGFWPDELTPILTKLLIEVVLKRSFMNHTNQLPLFLSWMIQKMKLPGQKDRTVVVLGTVNQCVW